MASSTPKHSKHARIPKKFSSTNYSQDKRTLSGNFTVRNKDLDISAPHSRINMRQNILEMVAERSESRINQDKRFVDDNSLYEDPKDLIGEKPIKPPRKPIMQGIAFSSPRSSKDGRSLLREQKKKLTKKYEQLISSLMERCEENMVQLSEKDSHISKLKTKLKAVLDYNKLFAEENDNLRAQYETISHYTEECKKLMREERERNRQSELRGKELEEKIKQYELPNRDQETTTAIPLVEVCMSCSSRQIIVNQAREHNTRLQKDMQALKDVLYRLNVQLSRYQVKIRNNIQSMAGGDKSEQLYKLPDNEALDSLINASLGYKGLDTINTDEAHTLNQDKGTYSSRTGDLSGLLSAQALAPLFDAYQENLQEKDTLILDYEKQFENINKKSKLVVSENKTLTDKVKSLEDELGQLRRTHKKLLVQKETADIEKSTLLERAEKAESKLKEVYELYEGKMGAMMRDYETVHREYFTVKSALDVSETKLAQLDVLRARTVPADMHERRLDHCKRLLEELKHQYAMEAERKGEQVVKLQEQLRLLEDKCTKASRESDSMKLELEKALKNVRLYRKAAVIFRQRLRSATARVTKARASSRRKKNNPEPLRQALHALDSIKREIKAVKSRAHSSLEELERRIVEQERRAANAHAEYRRELERAALALEHKEGIIRSLIDKVADVEEVRLSQTNTHRLQGIMTDSSPEKTWSNPDRKETRPVKQAHYQEKEGSKGKKRADK